jgi:hypothetical protein
MRERGRCGVGVRIGRAWHVSLSSGLQHIVLFNVLVNTFLSFRCIWSRCVPGVSPPALHRAKSLTSLRYH